MTIPTCCITGGIPGDGGACGDCDPCIDGEALVPEPVKRLIAEKNSVLNRIGDLEGENERLRAAIRWALGEEPDSEGRWFGDHEPEQGTSRARPFWWRKPLRKLSGIDEQTEDRTDA